MKHNYLTNTELNQAKEKFFSALKESGFSPKCETIPVIKANGRITAEAVYAQICSPHFNASAMDGVAVSAEDTFGASEVCPVILSKSKYSIVDTGDPIPDDKNAVIMVEDIVEDEEGNIKLISAVPPWHNVRQIGEDICMGDMLAPSGTEISPSLCGAFLAGGVLNVKVIRKPLFGIIPTGDEIVKPTSNPQKGEIIEFNSTVFSSMLESWGSESIVYDIVKDKKELLSDALNKAVQECDAVLVIAGSSAGRDDYTSTIISQTGKVIIHGIATKPGKPAMLGICADKPVFGLPGYPVSALVVMDEFVKETVSCYFKSTIKNDEYIDAVLSQRIVTSLKYKEYIRVTVGKTSQGYFAVPLPRGAGIITSFTKASGILEIDRDCEGIEAGTLVKIRLLKPKSVIDNALIITGSHDPIIDEIADIIKIKGYDFSVVSSHVGSMGAINAIKNGFAHMGAIHLLDTETGEYNSSYIRQYFPDGNAVLKKGIGRIQGFMVKQGNPYNIKSFSDLIGRRYVNRQRGAGTRILCDYLLKKEGLSPKDLNGYKNEKFTHTAVAALIASDVADAGLGIYSSAKMYNLDFVPVMNEEYDFLINKDYADDYRVKVFFEVLASEELKQRLEKLGGYSV